MFFPVPIRIHHSGEKESPPIANSLLIVINTLVFCLGWSSSWAVGPGTSIFSIVTYGFAHAGIPHLLGNMWLLWIFGNAVNRRIGNGYYITAYMGTIVVLGVLVRLFCSGYAMGSSGAIFAVIGIAVLLLPSSKVDIAYVAIFPITLLIGLFKKPKEMVFWFLRWGRFQMYAVLFLFICPLIELWGLWRWRVYSGAWSWTNLGHLLGFVCGVAVVLMLPKRVSMRQKAS